MLFAGHLAGKGIEVSPHHVNTDLGIPGSNGAGMDLKAYIDSMMERFAQGGKEVTCGLRPHRPGPAA